MFWWLGLFILLVLIELATVNMVTIWFALGALVSTFLSLITDNFILQLSVFIIVSILSLLCTKPFVRKMRKQGNCSMNLDRVIGKTGTVTERIVPDRIGEVYVDGKRWSAISNTIIDEDSKVEILAIEGVKLLVKPLEKEEER